MPLRRLTMFLAECDHCENAIEIGLYRGQSICDALQDWGWGYRHYVKIGWVSWQQPACIDVMKCPDHLLTEVAETDIRLTGYKLRDKVAA